MFGSLLNRLQSIKKEAGKELRRRNRFDPEGQQEQLDEDKRVVEAKEADDVTRIENKVEFVDACGDGEVLVPVTDPRMQSILDDILKHDKTAYVILDTKKETKGGVPINTLKVAQTTRDGSGKLSYVVSNMCVKKEVLDNIEQVQGLGSEKNSVEELLKLIQIFAKYNGKTLDDSVQLKKASADIDLLWKNLKEKSAKKSA